MNQKLELNDFDILGIIRLKDVKGIEKYVTPILDENGEAVEYLSRSKEYYNVKNMTQLSTEREFLKEKLTREITRRNFVILENMLNCSARVYFKKLENYLNNKKDENLQKEVEQAEKCMLEDTRNLLVILKKEGLINLEKENVLPIGDENAEKRFIEMDNKSLIYIFAECLNQQKLEENIEIVLPGYGGLYIGPFLKEIYGYEFTNILKSKYIKDTSQLSKESTILENSSSNRPFEKGKTVIILDDNVGTGQTMQELKRELEDYGIQSVLTGAIQFNWRNFYRVSVGDKKDITRFNPEQFDLLSPINYAGHKLYKHAIDQLHSSGNSYVEYLMSKSYQKDNLTDLRGQIDRGIICARRCNLELMPDYEYQLISYSYPQKELLDKYKEGVTEISNPLSRELIENIMHYVKGIEDKRERSMTKEINS